VHTDVGRGYDDHVPNDIADITFAWMVDQCHGLLAFNENKVLQMLKEGDFKQPEGVDAKKRWEDRIGKAKTWGLARLHDSMTLLFKIGGSKTRTPGQYTFKPRDWAHEKADNSSSGKDFVTESRILANSQPEAKSVSGVFGGPPEDVMKLDSVSTFEVIHPSVRLRMMKDQAYDPPALKDFKLLYDAPNTRWTWVKTWTDANGDVREKRLNEYRIKDPSFALSQVTAEMLKSGIDNKEPLPPRQTNKSWFSFW
jgi:hypothetical protein